MTKDNLDIFICTHKDFEVKVKGQQYKIICGEDTEIKDPNGLMVVRETNTPEVTNVQPSLGEVSRIYWVWKNWDVKEYVGFCHYRRVILDDKEVILNLLNKSKFVYPSYKSIIPVSEQEPGTIIGQYSFNHNGDDLLDCVNIMSKMFDININTLLDTINKPMITYGNIFVTKKEDFNQYCHFLFSILTAFRGMHNIHNMSDIKKHIDDNVDKYIKKEKNQETVDYNYQSRFLGFLSERIFNIYLYLLNQG